MPRSAADSLSRGGQTAAIEADARLASDGSQYASDHTAKNVSWWSSLSSDFLQLTTDQNTQEAAAPTVTNGLFTTLVSNINTTVATHTSTMATADETLASALATAERDFVQALTGPTETYTGAVALAEYNYDVTLAAAQQNLDLGERLFELSTDGEGNAMVTRLADGFPTDPYSQSEFDTDKGDAESAKEQALKAAGEVYATAHATAAGTSRQAIAAANSAYAASKTAADQTLVDARGAENETYEHAVADREKQREETNASLQAAYDKQAASTRATLFSDLATTTPSHFATLFSGMASAAADFVDDAADAVKDLKSEIAEDFRIYTRALASDDKALASSLVGAAGTLTTSVLDAHVTAANTAANLLNNLASLGGHTPTLPSVATAPTVTVPDITVADPLDFSTMVVDTNNVDEDSTWIALVDGVAITQANTPYVQQDGQSTTRLTTDRLDSGLVRDQIKPDESLYEGLTPSESISKAFDSISAVVSLAVEAELRKPLSDKVVPQKLTVSPLNDTVIIQVRSDQKVSFSALSLESGEVKALPEYLREQPHASVLVNHPKDETVLVGTDTGAIERIGVDGKGGLGRFVGLTSPIRAIAIDPNGQLLVASDSVGGLAGWEMATKRRIFQSSKPGYCYDELDWIPTTNSFAALAIGQSRAVQDLKQRIRELLRSRRELCSVGLPGGQFVADIAVSPDGKLAAYACSNELVRVVDAFTGHIKWEFEPKPEEHFCSVAFNRNSAFLVAASLRSEQGKSVGMISTWKLTITKGDSKNE